MRNLKNQINPRKLLLSKWTSVIVLEKEKHFIITRLLPTNDASDKLDFVEMEAILTNSLKTIPIQDLKEKSKWLPGWI
ncbi:MAG: TIGR02450 family Trp-rich protein [Leptospira sp.]|nr:TIGR02450 family Trp-rich protein [Leptospira sp.]